MAPGPEPPLLCVAPFPQEPAGAPLAVHAFPWPGWMGPPTVLARTAPSTHRVDLPACPRAPAALPFECCGLTCAAPLARPGPRGPARMTLPPCRSCPSRRCAGAGPTYGCAGRASIRGSRSTDSLPCREEAAAISGPGGLTAAAHSAAVVAAADPSRPVPAGSTSDAAADDRERAGAVPALRSRLCRDLELNSSCQGQGQGPCRAHSLRRGAGGAVPALTVPVTQRLGRAAPPASSHAASGAGPAVAHRNAADNRAALHLSPARARAPASAASAAPAASGCWGGGALRHWRP